MIISKFPGRQVKIAKQIELETDQSTDYSYDVAKLLKRQLRNSILHKSNRISINFFNKLLSYQIKSFNGNTSAEDLVQQFENITISDQFYLVDSASDILISGEISVCDPGDQQPKKPLQTLIQVGGCDHIIDELKKSMDLALGLIENNSCFKISRGALLYGISGIGKSLICEGLANNYPSALKIRIEASNIFSKFYGESEVNLKKVFNQAFQNYPSPTVMIIDELYNICPKNDSTDAVKRISTLLVSKNCLKLLELLHNKIFLKIQGQLNRKPSHPKRWWKDLHPSQHQ